LTFDPRIERHPVWSPDGAHIAFSVGGLLGGKLQRKPADGSGDAALLLDAAAAVPQDWSPDGRHLLYLTYDAKTGSDLWVLPLEGDRKPFPFQVTPFIEAQARFSPDGRFVAYLSSESGRAEVYVRPFVISGATDAGAQGGKWMVSNGGGVQPRWRSDGREILYLAPSGKLMSVGVTATGSSLQAAAPVPLF
jgi:Tol biopolymer transport system component